MNKYAFAALKDKRAELTGQIKSIERQVKTLKRELAHLDATMRLFDPTFDPRTVKPRKASRVHLFKQGELGRLIIDTLRKADGEALSTAAIAKEVADAIGQPSARTVIARRVRANLAYLQHRQGAVTKVGSRERATWRLARLPLTG